MREEAVIQMLSGRSILWPQELADEIIHDSRGLLDELSKDPVMGAARFQ